MVGVMEGRMTLRAVLRGLRWWAVRSVTGVQVGAGIAVMASKAALIGSAHGQVAGSRSRWRRPPRVSRAGTCRSR